MTNKVKLGWVVEFRASEQKEKATDAMSLGELLYWVLFGEGRVEPVQEQLQS